MFMMSVPPAAQQPLIAASPQSPPQDQQAAQQQMFVQPQMLPAGQFVVAPQSLGGAPEMAPMAASDQASGQQQMIAAS